MNFCCGPIKSMVDRYSEKRRASIVGLIGKENSVPSDYDVMSLFTAKSCTPILKKDQYDDPFTPSPFGQSNRVCDNLMDSPRSFCTQYTVDQCLSYLDQEFISLGMPSLFSGRSNTIELPRILNNMYRLLQSYRQNNRLRDDQETRQVRTESELKHLREVHESLKCSLAEKERENGQMKMSWSQCESKNNQLALGLKAEKDEVKRLQSAIQHKEAQFKHEMRKREMEMTKLKERLHQKLSDKTEKRVCINITSACTKVAPADRSDIYRTLIGDYENKERKLVRENLSLRDGLKELQNELVALLQAQTSTPKKSCERSQKENKDTLLTDASFGTENMNDKSVILSPSNEVDLCEDTFQMPYDVIADDVLKSLKQKCHLLKRRLNKLQRCAATRKEVESRVELKVDSSVESKQEEIDGLHSDLSRFQSIIEQQEHVIQTLMEYQEGEVSFLRDSEQLDRNESLASREQFFKDLRLRLDDAIYQMYKQMRANEEAKYTVLHDEFLQLTPLCFGKDQSNGRSALKIAEEFYQINLSK